MYQAGAETNCWTEHPRAASHARQNKGAIGAGEGHRCVVRWRHLRLALRELVQRNLQPLVHALILALDDVPSVARKVAFAIHNLASAFQTQSDLLQICFRPFLCNSSRNCLRSPRRWVSRLISAATRLRRSTSLSQTARTTCTWLYSSFSALCASASTPPLHFRPTRPRRRTRVTACRRFYAARFSSIVQKLGTQVANENVGDAIMQLMLKLFQCRNTPALSDAFLVVGAIADAFEGRFERYVTQLLPFLQAGLQNHEAYQVCAAAVGVVGDLTRALEAKMQPLCDGIITPLGNNLTSAHLDKSVKPPILSVFGDIALAIGLQFERYVPTVLAMLDQASQTKIDTDDEDLVEYANTLRQESLRHTLASFRASTSGRAKIRPSCSSFWALSRKIS